MTKARAINAIDALLPQTQCGLCDYAGCKPYAKAMLEDNAPLDRCLPGGVETLHALGNYFDRDITNLIPEMQQKQKPIMQAVIREDECIGCTKCIQACPVDAIVGSAKLMHTVLASECTGCELCVEPCPMDCIDMVQLAIPDTAKPAYYAARKDYWRERYHAHLARLEQHQAQTPQALVEDEQDYIANALARVKRQRQTNE